MPSASEAAKYYETQSPPLQPRLQYQRTATLHVLTNHGKTVYSSTSSCPTKSSLPADTGSDAKNCQSNDPPPQAHLLISTRKKIDSKPKPFANAPSLLKQQQPFNQQLVHHLASSQQKMSPSPPESAHTLRSLPPLSPPRAAMPQKHRRRMVSSPRESSRNMSITTLAR